MSATPSEFRSARLITVLTLCSRVLGLARESLFSRLFGTSGTLSAFRLAFMLPNLARRLFGEGALSAALVPTLTESLRDRGEEASRRFVGSLLTLLACTLVVVVIVAELIVFAARGWSDDLALKLAAVLLPYMVLICVVAAASGVLHVRGHYAVPAAAPIILNLVVIGSAIGGAYGAGLSGESLLYVIGAGVLLAGGLQVVATGVALRAMSFFPIFTRAWRDPSIRKMLALMAPMVLGLSAVQINSLADYLIAYLFIVEDGERSGPAVLGYAQYLYQLPLGVFGIAIATAIFPTLAQQGAAGARVELSETLLRGIRLALFVAIPASVGLIFVANPLVGCLFGGGQFGVADTHRVAGVLVCYSLGLVAYFLQHLLVRTFYALKNSRTPARVAVRMVVVNFALNLALVFSWKERGLALATAVCATVQVGWLIITLGRQLPELSWRTIASPVSRIVGASAVMTFVLFVWQHFAGSDQVSRAGDIGRLALQVLVGAGVYAMAAKVLKLEELGWIVRAKQR